MRSYANVVTSIWDDPEFCALSAGAQRTYFMLFSQKEISACGILPLTVRRWSSTVQSAEQNLLPGWLTELVAHHYICVDDSTEEMLVRSFIRHDKGWSNRNRLPVILADMGAVRSADLRRTLAAEAAKLNLNVETVFPQVNRASDGASDAPADGPPDAPADGHSVALNLKPQTLNHNPLSPSGRERASAPAPTRTRGTPMTPEFLVTPEMRTWAETNVPTLNIGLATSKFINYFLAESGAKSVKKDWTAAWRNWMLRDYEQGGPRTNGHSRPQQTGQQMSTGEQRAAGAIDAARLIADVRTHTTNHRQIGAS